jgi:hypothetical protein
MPDARPVMAKSGELVVEFEPLLRLGGEPVAKRDDNRLDPLVGLLMELDIGFYFITTIKLTNSSSSTLPFYGKSSDSAPALSEI